ncbi:hypothetical protein OJAV_G00187950 [Oryzias javanicus]|uniref:MsrB domain-containing protein n=1 Tax=Oryzias javanicus TaxID=123683 RepID=A0A437C9D9_ORYJA|nr:hypothetical protein OJAV_G00187950 [Oryzias javanicus]
MSFCRFVGGEIYKDHFKPGIYVCSNCNHPLFSSRSKFAHSSPWPAFTETLREDSVTKLMETLTAYKVLCGKCGSGLGHDLSPIKLKTSSKERDGRIRNWSPASRTGQRVTWTGERPDQDALTTDESLTEAFISSLPHIQTIESLHEA